MHAHFVARSSLWPYFHKPDAAKHFHSASGCQNLLLLTSSSLASHTGRLFSKLLEAEVGKPEGLMAADWNVPLRRRFWYAEFCKRC